MLCFEIFFGDAVCLPPSCGPRSTLYPSSLHFHASTPRIAFRRPNLGVVHGPFSHQPAESHHPRSEPVLVGSLVDDLPPWTFHSDRIAITFFVVRVSIHASIRPLCLCLAGFFCQLERARAILQKTSGGFGKLCVMMDYVGFSLRTAPAMKISLATVNVLQHHYPETLGQAFFVTPPLVFKGFWKVGGVFEYNRGQDGSA